MSAKVYQFSPKSGTIDKLYRHGHAPASAFERLMSDSAPSMARSVQSSRDEDQQQRIAPTMSPVSERAAGIGSAAGDGVQAWSKGAIYPAIIAVIERYSIGGQLQSTSYELSFQGHAEEYATWSDAEQVARALIAGTLSAANWGHDAFTPEGQS